MKNTKDDKEIEYVDKNDIQCARCLNRTSCRGLNGPIWDASEKCDEFRRDWSVRQKKHNVDKEK